MTLGEFIKSKSDKSTDDDDLVKEIWKSSLTVKEKLILSLELNTRTPSYFTLSAMWFEYGLTREVNKGYNDMIYSNYQFQLSNSDKDLSDTTEYSLYFNIFEDPGRNGDAWEYFLSNNPSKKFIKIMLANSGPVPYDSKHKLYEELLKDKDFHIDIYTSIRHNCFDNCRQIDRVRARDILYKLDLDGKMDEINKSDSYPKFSDVALFLKD
jgi:hypothetical protein